MQVYLGASALSDFRTKKLLKIIQKVEPAVQAISARYVHFVDAKQTAKATDARLKQLFDYGEPFSADANGELFLVIPRPGTISPWSSKATDIARNCGLTMVNRIERGVTYYVKSKGKLDRRAVAQWLHDRMTQIVVFQLDDAKDLFIQAKPKPHQEINLIKGGRQALVEADQAMGMALSEPEIDYLNDAYQKLGRNPTDVELMMFAQINSEHARHKIFNADWVINGQPQSKSLFGIIKNTYAQSKRGVVSAYSDNAAVLNGPNVERLITTANQPSYHYQKQAANIVIKAETHNHPTAISPFPGAATGIGGEIRDESATGRGGKPKASFTGYSVSNLKIPDTLRPWEKDYGKPNRISSALDIMLEAPIGGAGYANEFGRPNIAGYFRTYEQQIDDQVYGYHKPIMIAGGLGNITDQNAKKANLKAGDVIVVLGGPAMLIGLGGGAASSMQTGHGEEELDFASVQRDNAEMQRRTQEVIDRCWALQAKNPIITIGDVGAGGLSNAIPEMLHDSNVGGSIELRDIPNADLGMSPMEIWSNEAQERYVVGIAKRDLENFKKICQRERCPLAIVGEASVDSQLTVTDKHFKNRPVNLPLGLLFGNPPKLTKQVRHQKHRLPTFQADKIEVAEAVERVLRLPAVGSKKFLITIGDRTVGGLVTRDPMVGSWQVPVGDVAVTAASFHSKSGEAMAIGERAPLALIDSPAAARMAVGEAITNIAAADIAKLSDIKLSANWMAASGEPIQDQALFEAVKALGEEFCPALKIAIPVGKDSLSMRTKWQENGKQESVTAPVSLIVSAFAPVVDTNQTLTPPAHKDLQTSLILIDLGGGRNRLGGSALAQVYNQLGDSCPDIAPQELARFFEVLTEFKRKGQILAYHDRSDGGLLTTVAEMAFASRMGFEIDLTDLPGSTAEKIFNEELGALIQVRQKDADDMLKLIDQKLAGAGNLVGSPRKDQQLVFKDGGKVIYQNSRQNLEKIWAETSYLMQKLRDNPKLADEEYRLIEIDDPGLFAKTDFKARSKSYRTKPKVAILREQGVNGQVEMAAVFIDAGFTAVDVHLTDLLAGRAKLADFKGLVTCGGFSYGDVLGAGEGMAKTILFNSQLKAMFAEFFARPDSFSLGVCNGCQTMAALKDIIPGAEHWPRFLRNRSEQFEARQIMVKVNHSPSIFFKDTAGWCLPIVVAHGEGRAGLSRSQANKAIKEDLVPLQFVDNFGKPTEKYPYNPNGSPLGITSLSSQDGRATILMPHPERTFLSKQFSWQPADWGEFSPWFKIFQNARNWAE